MTQLSNNTSYLGLPLQGKISIGPQICVDSDKGILFVLKHMDSKPMKVFMEIVEKIKEYLKKRVPRKTG